MQRRPGSKARKLLIGYSSKPSWLLVVNRLVVLRFQLLNLEAFTDVGLGLLKEAAIALEPPEYNDLLV